jgi:hypothetical protein
MPFHRPALWPYTYERPHLMRLIPVAKGVATYSPVLYKVMAKWRAGGTGGTDTAAYCYGVWLKHLTLLWANSLRAISDTIAELGPGDSLGIGLAALLSGVNHYYALDVVHYANTPRNLLIFDQLVALVQQHAGWPAKGWPDYDQYLDANLFPSHILTKRVLKMALALDRLLSFPTPCRSTSSTWKTPAGPARCGSRPAVGCRTRLTSPRITWRTNGTIIGLTQTGCGRSSWASGPFTSIGNRAPTTSSCYALAGSRSCAT